MTVACATELTIECGHVELVPVHFDDLDPNGMVHNARYALLIERALETFWSGHGHTFRDGRPTTPDAFNVVKEFSVSYRAPISGVGEVRVHFWLEHLGSSSAVYAYRLQSPDGATVYADGQRVVVKLDQATRRPSPWTPEVRTVAEGLLRHQVRAQPGTGAARLDLPVGEVDPIKPEEEQPPAESSEGMAHSHEVVLHAQLCMTRPIAYRS